MLGGKTQTAKRVLAVNPLFYTSACTAIELLLIITTKLRKTPDAPLE
ncbi:hypothetical protein AA0111_g9118 [Alternaria arborescens]|nr:hypothetical protein AA0111_g9118 [Alternaria arborescens]RYO22954.1 hypothetical protein AA0111_g9118 [Alternaria arborescens]